MMMVVSMLAHPLYDFSLFSLLFSFYALLPSVHHRSAYLFLNSILKEENGTFEPYMKKKKE